MNPAGQGVYSTEQQYTATVMSQYASSSAIPPVHLQGQPPPGAAEHFPIHDVEIGDCVILRDVAISAQGHYADLSTFSHGTRPIL